MMKMKFQSKSITPVDDYKVNLSEDNRKFIEKEFRETDDVRKHAIATLREWALKNPRINKLRLDSNFLLRFLRAKKFSLPMTQEMIERYLVLRWYTQEGIKVFQNLDVKLPVMQELLDLGYIFALPQRDALQRRIIFYRPGVFNPSKHCNHEMIKLHGIVYETLMEDEQNQIHGFVHVIDSSGIGFHYLTLFTPHEAYRIGKNLEKLLPMRQKEIHGLKVHSSVKFAVDFALAQMSEKMRKRVFLHKKVEDISGVIDADLLPIEYGGNVPMKSMIDAFKIELLSNRQLLLNNDQMSVNLEKYPQAIREGSVRSLKMSIDSYNSFDDRKEIYGMQGSFRKLEID